MCRYVSPELTCSCLLSPIVVLLLFYIFSIFVLNFDTLIFSSFFFLFSFESLNNCLRVLWFILDYFFCLVCFIFVVLVLCKMVTEVEGALTTTTQQ